MGHSQVAKSVRENKEQHPEFYCPDPRCLWRTNKRGTFVACPKHAPNALSQRDSERIANEKAWASL
jgi:hypothetical protein